MTNSPKISVIFPVYNNAEFLTKSLNSLCCQTYSEFEVICINYGSTDNSLAILNNFKDNDTRIHVYSQDNFGIEMAMSYGLNKAKGDYISFINPKDWVFLTLYQTFVDTLERVECEPDIYIFNASLYNPENNDVVQAEFFDIRDWNGHSSMDVRHKFQDCQNPFTKNLSLYNKIYSKVFLEKNNIVFPEFLHYGDIYFSIKSLMSANSILINEEILYRERIVKTPFSSDESDIFKVFDLIEREIGSYKDLKYALFQFKYNLFVEHYKYCKPEMRESFYNTMKFRLLSSETLDLDKRLLSHLRNYELFDFIKNHPRRDFDRTFRV